MREELRRMALIGSGVAELTKARAEQIVKDWVKKGEVGSSQAAGMVKDLMERSKDNRKEIMAFVRGEIRSQIESLGVATKRDVERLERRVARLEDKAKSAPKSTATKSTAKKTAAKKSTAKKTSAKKSTAKKSTTSSDG